VVIPLSSGVAAGIKQLTLPPILNIVSRFLNGPFSSLPILRNRGGRDYSALLHVEIAAFHPATLRGGLVSVALPRASLTRNLALGIPRHQLQKDSAEG